MKNLTVSANALRKGDRIVDMIWPEGRVVADLSHGPVDNQVRVIFEGGNECHAFFDSTEQISVLRLTDSFDEAITEYYEDRANSGLAALSH